MESLNLSLIQRVLWPLFGVFLVLAFSDVITTVVASASSPGFVELNPFAAELFKLKLSGFVLAYVVKLMPAVPLFYMVALRCGPETDDFQVRLLKFTAMVVLIGADALLAVVVFANNLPQLLGFARV